MFGVRDFLPRYTQEYVADCRSSSRFRGSDKIKPGTENEIAGKVHEVTGKTEAQSGPLTRTDTMIQNKWSNKFTTFALGVGIGTVIGLLFAPASGKKTRNYIADTVKQGLDDAASTGKRWSRRGLEAADDVRAKVVGVVEAGQKAYRTARNA
jgi:gas vesicle protein